jgi:hypothetical protein
MSEFGLNPGTVSLAALVLAHIVGMAWWGSSMNSRLNTLEEHRDSFTDRLDLLEQHIKETKDMLHKMEVLLARIDERVGSSKASLAQSP